MSTEIQTIPQNLLDLADALEMNLRGSHNPGNYVLYDKEGFKLFFTTSYNKREHWQVSVLWQDENGEYIYHNCTGLVAETYILKTKAAAQMASQIKRTLFPMRTFFLEQLESHRKEKKRKEGAQQITQTLARLYGGSVSKYGEGDKFHGMAGEIRYEVQISGDGAYKVELRYLPIPLLRQVLDLVKEESHVKI